MRRLLIALFALLLISGIALAHQPRIVSEENTIVSNPEVSQAFYAVLEGDHQHYQITSEEPFTLYVGITVPDIEGAETDFSASITGEEYEVILDGTVHQWESFYEPFGGDSYLNGPEIREQVPAGTYEIEVYSTDNQGKYVLAIGYKEEFPIDEFFNTLIALPKIKQFFGKPAFTAYFNLIGLMFFGPIIVILIAAFLLYRRIRR